MAADCRGRAFLLARRAFLDARIRTLSFACLFAAAAYVKPVRYRHTYATRAERLQFAHSFAHNKAVVLFYGKAYDLLTVGGYSAWRTGGIVAILAGVFGLLSAVRALRAEEDSGRAELVLSSSVSRGSAFGGSLMAIGAGIALLWAAVLAGSLLARLPTGGAAYHALAATSSAPVFAGVGALASQLASTRRVALELGSGRPGRGLSPARRRRRVDRRGMASLGHPARLGGGAAPIHRRPAAGPAPAAHGDRRAAHGRRCARAGARRRRRTAHLARGGATALGPALFLCQLFGSLFGAPSWLVKVTPFAHVAAVPAQPLRTGAAIIMVAIGVLAAAAALVAFERRDLTGA